MKVLVIGSGFGAHVMAPAYGRAGFDVRMESPRDEAAVVRAIGENPDLVSVHSPPFLHARHVLLALEQGCAVLCDKPFGLDEADARVMRDRARALGLPNFVNFELRRRPARLKVGQLLDQGAIGALSHVNWTMFGSALRQQCHGWLHDAAKGGGWIGAYGAHCIDALSVWTRAEIIRCGGIARRDMPMRPDAHGVLRACSAEDAFSAWLEFAGGVTATLDSGFSTTSTMPERVWLFGTDGAIELQDDDVLILHRPDGRQERFDFPVPAGDSYAPALNDWLGAVRSALAEGRSLAPDFDAGLANTRALAVLRAALVQGASPDLE